LRKVLVPSVARVKMLAAVVVRVVPLEPITMAALSALFRDVPSKQYWDELNAVLQVMVNLPVAVRVTEEML
jgi:hypothetical protein